MTRWIALAATLLAAVPVPAVAVLGVAVPAVAVLLAGTGCGYKLVDYSEPPDNLHSIAIETLENDSYEPGIELVVGDAMRREFLRRGAIALSQTPDDADMVLSGKIPRLWTQTRSYSPVGLALEFEVTLQLDVTAKRRDGSEIELDASSLRLSERYLASADMQATLKNRQEALRKMSAVLASRVHDLLYETNLP